MSKDTVYPACVFGDIEVGANTPEVREKGLCMSKSPNVVVRCCKKTANVLMRDGKKPLIVEALGNVNSGIGLDKSRKEGIQKGSGIS